MRPNLKAFGCHGHTIRMNSGAYLDLTDPNPALITLWDISRALANICRFGGQCDYFYSVAEHSVACMERAQAEGLSREVQLACLMHDAAEAFLGDVVKPLKILIEPIYGPLEDKMEAAIAKVFGVDFELTAADWKRIDRMMLIAERRALFSADKVVWTGENEVEKIDYVPRCYAPVLARDVFVDRFEALKSSESP